MIPKVVGYQGFQSYGDLPYASLKPGRQTLDSNQVWEKTERQEDKVSFYRNSNYHYSNRNTTMDQTVKPEHYKNVETVKKGHSFQKSNSVFTKTGETMLNNEDENKVKTGCEHWVSNYTAAIVDPYSISKAQRPEWTFHKPPYQVETQFKHLSIQPSSSKVGPSEYKTSFGHLGENPRDKIADLKETNPRGYDELRQQIRQSILLQIGNNLIIRSFTRLYRIHTISHNLLEGNRAWIGQGSKKRFHENKLKRELVRKLIQKTNIKSCKNTWICWTHPKISSQLT